MLSARHFMLPAALLLAPASVWAQTEAEPAILGATQEKAAPAAADPAVAANRTESAASVVPDPGAPVTLSPMRRGDILMARKRYREAIDTYQEGLQEAAILYNKMGIGYHHLLDFKAALEHYQKALQVAPTYAEAINNIGTVYYAQRNYGRAIRQYDLALRYAPKSASIYNNLGTAYYARKQYDRAFEALSKALELDPNVFENRGTTGSMLQERSVAERAQYYYYLARAYAGQGIVDRTLIYMRKALEDGFKDRDKFRREPEFAAFQENPEFQALLTIEPRVL